MAKQLKIKKEPLLRFPEFDESWRVKRTDEILDRVSNPVNVDGNELYTQIGVRSHGKGLFYKEPVTGKSLGKKRVFWVQKDVFLVNIVFAWEQAIARTTQKEVGMIASHRFPMYAPKNSISDLNYVLYFFLTRKGKHLLELASPGGAGRNKTLGQQEFAKLKFPIPSYCEQQKIADFLTSIDTRIQQLTQKVELLEDYKKGVMQQIFSQEIRFKDDQGHEFPDWEEKNFGRVFERVTRKNKENNQNVLTISAQQGLVNQQDYFNKSVAAKDVTGYYLLQRDEFAYNKSYSKGYPLGAIKRLSKYDKGVVSTLYICFKPKGSVSHLFMEHFFESGGLNREIHKIAQEGARNHGLLNVSVVEFFKDIHLTIPSVQEQEKIADFLGAVDQKIDLTKCQLNELQSYKKGLLQQMFV